MMASRVRGIVVERLGSGRAIILSPGGEFHEVWLRPSLGRAEPGIGCEAEGVVVPRALVWVRSHVAAWPRAAVATALAFGAAGAVMAAVYLRPDTGVTPSVSATRGAGATVEAQDASAPLPDAAGEKALGPAVRPAGMAERLEAPKLSVSWRPGDWASLRLSAETPWASSSRMRAAASLQSARALSIDLPVSGALPSTGDGRGSVAGGARPEDADTATETGASGTAPATVVPSPSSQVPPDRGGNEAPASRRARTAEASGHSDTSGSPRLAVPSLSPFDSRLLRQEP